MTLMKLPWIVRWRNFFSLTFSLSLSLSHIHTYVEGFDLACCFINIYVFLVRLYLNPLMEDVLRLKKWQLRWSLSWRKGEFWELNKPNHMEAEIFDGSSFFQADHYPRPRIFVLRNELLIWKGIYRPWGKPVSKFVWRKENLPTSRFRQSEAIARHFYMIEHVHSI
jgi:hypothetical protein